jgi:hypothetical protein
MPSLAALPVHEFRKALTRENVMVLQLIYLAIGGGVLAFLIAISVIGAGADGSGPMVEDPLPMLTWLTAAHVAIAIVLYGAAAWLFRSRFSPSRLEALGKGDLVKAGGESTSDPALKALLQMRTAHILRLALYEGVAMVGLVVLLLAVVNRALEGNPWLWVNILSTVILAGLIAVTFPTPDRLETLFRTHIAGKV